ncbi:hypothetical protein QYE76_052349 [Lolium multiflorum]|uniref:Uncharacterized protein n=1 Tax=Lolium multiflorum TaxID=4521 RepID=A0AAD8SUJ6_LOLMU|nr:hypothetical protein QYE76_052349 [Lolium multiflorum]
MPEKTTSECKCQNYHGGTLAKQHVAHAAVAGGGRTCCHEWWRHVGRMPGGGPCRHRLWRHADVDMPRACRQARGATGRCPVAAPTPAPHHPVSRTKLPNVPPPLTAASPAATGYGGMCYVSLGQHAATVVLTFALRGGLFWGSNELSFSFDLCERDLDVCLRGLSRLDLGQVQPFSPSSMRVTRAGMRLANSNAERGSTGVTE